MFPTTPSYNNFIGIDIGKGAFVVALNADKKTHTFTNDETGICAFIQQFKAFLQDGLVVVEHTGGYERQLLNILFYEGFQVHKAHSPLIKAFIKSYGLKAKTDHTDAKAIARYAEERGPKLPVYTPRDEDQEALRQWTERREDLIKMRTQEKNRRKGPCQDYVKDSIQKTLDYLDEEIENVDHQIKKITSQNNKEEMEVVTQISGIGQIIAQTLFAFLPELGKISHAAIASLVGLAPYANESGSCYKRRCLYGGRAMVRQKMFTAAMAAAHSKSDLRDYYQRLLERGKKPMVALMAVARKMLIRANAKLRDYYKSLVTI